MTQTLARPTVGMIVYYVVLGLMGAYFAFAAIQGKFGIFRQVQIHAETTVLTEEHDRLSTELARLTNLTHRLSDTYLDLDLLDQQARDVLGYLRADDIVIR